LHQPRGLVPPKLNWLVSIFPTTPHDAQFSLLVCPHITKYTRDARTFLSDLEIINISFAF